MMAPLGFSGHECFSRKVRVRIRMVGQPFSFLPCFLSVCLALSLSLRFTTSLCMDSIFVINLSFICSVFTKLTEIKHE